MWIKRWSTVVIGLSLLMIINQVLGQGAPMEGPVNPVLKKYADNITFYINFDNGDLVPALSVGNPKPKVEQGKVTYEKGLLKKCLRSGMVMFHGNKNVDFTKPGTVIFWTAPWKWDREKAPGYYWPFIAGMVKMKIQAGRQAAKTWNKTRIYAFLTAPKKGDNVYLPIYGAGGKTWQDGVWHMIALTWNASDLGLSVDGKPQATKTLPMPMTKSSWMRIGTNKDPDKGTQNLTDEMVILNKRLNDAELKALYDETLKESKNQK